MINMKRIAYVFGELPPGAMTKLDGMSPNLRFHDDGIDWRLRPQFKTAISRLEPGDELILIRFSNALRHTCQLSLLLDFCRLRGVRLISVEDEIDTHELLFGQSSAIRLMQIIAALPNDILLERRAAGEMPVKEVSAVVQHKRELRVHRERKVVALYLAGQSLEVIMCSCGIRHTSLYDILRRNGISCDRRSRKRLSPNNNVL